MKHYAVDAEWAVNYTSYLNAQDDLESFNSINNNNLFDKICNKGKFLKLNEDYVILNDIIWKLLIKLYGGEPEIDASWVRDFNLQFSDQDLIIPPIGIENAGTTCYQNAVFQILLSIKEFNTYFLNKLPNLKVKPNIRSSIAFAELVEIMSKTQMNNYISTESLKKLYKKEFNSLQEHDAQEFLRFILSEIQEELNLKSISKDYYSEDAMKNSQTAWKHYFTFHHSIVDSLFAGFTLFYFQFESTVLCKSCKQESKTFDPFLDLSISIEKQNNLIDCLTKFFDTETIFDQYFCEHCKQKGQVNCLKFNFEKATKSTKMTKLPRVLVIHLKRFKTAENKQKLAHAIKFPINNLNLAKYTKDIKKNLVYQLFGMIIHIGNQESGHYITIAERNSKWYNFDDELITLTDPKTTLANNAYLLFYKQVN